MSEATRAARQRILNRLEELRSKHGHEGEWTERGPPLEGAEVDPSWGPVGTLARASLDPLTFAHLVALNENMLQLERSRRGAADDGVSSDMPSEVQPAPVGPTVEHIEPPPQSRPRRRKKVEDAIVDLGGA